MGVIHRKKLNRSLHRPPIDSRQSPDLAQQIPHIEADAEQRAA